MSSVQGSNSNNWEGGSSSVAEEEITSPSPDGLELVGRDDAGPQPPLSSEADTFEEQGVNSPPSTMLEQRADYTGPTDERAMLDSKVKEDDGQPIVGLEQVGPNAIPLTTDEMDCLAEKGAAGEASASSRNILDTRDGGQPVPFNSAEFEDRITKKEAMASSPSQQAPATRASTADANQQDVVHTEQSQDEESALVINQNRNDHDEEHEEEHEEPAQADDADRHEIGQDNQEAVIHIPEAFPVEEGGDSNANIVIDALAEPLTPWFKQSRTKILLSLMCILIVVATVALAVTMTREQPPATVIINATSTPTLEPTVAPTSSQMPSFSPTTCVQKISAMMQTLDVPIDDMYNQRLDIHGQNMVVVARDGIQDDQIKVSFFTLQEGLWSRNELFPINYPDSNPDDIYDYSIVLYGSSALLGLPLDREGAGSVRIFEMNPILGLWEMVEEPLVAEDARHGTHFGYGVDMNDNFAAVSSFDDNKVYLFHKNIDQWLQLSSFQVEENPHGLYLSGQTIMTGNVYAGSISFHQYKEDLGQVVQLQDTLVVDPVAHHYPDWTTQITTAGMSVSLSGIRATDNYFVYSTLVHTFDWTNNDVVTMAEGVYIYTREDASQPFTLLQFLNASDFEGSFGWNIAPDKDLIVIGSGGDGTWPPIGKAYVFSRQDSGYFEEAFQLDDEFATPKLSGRRMIALFDNSTSVISLDLTDCTQDTPTQSPSASIAPTPIPTKGGPTTNSPTSSKLPSAVPSFSWAPSTSLAPSHAPSSSSAPTLCFEVQVSLMTIGQHLEGFEDDVTHWELYERDSGEIVLQGDQFKQDDIDDHYAECVQEGIYVFNISNSNDNGFGDCDNCMYSVWVNNIMVGGDTTFYSNDKVTFPVTANVDESEMMLCGFDFALSLLASEKPEDITWEVTNDAGDTVLSGGPYNIPFATYREWACLPAGVFTFTIYDSGDENDVSSYGSYFIGIKGPQIIAGPSDFNFFGSSASTTFVLND